MNFLKAIKALILLLCFSSYVNAELQPYTAVYDVYSKGFHIGEATQTLKKQNEVWLITLHTQAQGLASFLQSKPSIQEQFFKLDENNQPILISAKSDSGKSKESSIKTAHVDTNKKQLIIKTGEQSKTLPIKKSLLPNLALAITTVSVENTQSANLKVYEKGKIKDKTMSYQGFKEGFKIFDIGNKKSSKKLRYLFNPNNKQVPYKIEKLKKGKVKAYLKLKSFNGKDIS